MKVLKLFCIEHEVKYCRSRLEFIYLHCDCESVSEKSKAKQQTYRYWTLPRIYGCICGRFVGSNREAQSFLTRHSAEGGTQIIVRMRGLPYTCTAEQVVGIAWVCDKLDVLRTNANPRLYIHTETDHSTHATPSTF